MSDDSRFKALDLDAGI